MIYTWVHRYRASGICYLSTSPITGGSLPDLFPFWRPRPSCPCSFSSPARAASFFWGAEVRRLVPKVSCRVVELFLDVATRPTLTSPHHLTSSTHAGLLHRGATTVLMACQRLCHQASASESDVYPSCLLASLPPASRFSIHRSILYCTTCRPGDCDGSGCVSICCGSFISFHLIHAR